MNVGDLRSYFDRFKFREDSFHELMKDRVRDILLVSTFYDAFIFEQDGGLSEQLFGDYSKLNLSAAPRITSVPTARDALELLGTRHFDLVVTVLRIGDMTPYDLAARVKASHPTMPVLLLLNTQADVAFVERNRQKLNNIDEVFLWSGDSQVFLAMIKLVEDRRNLLHDTQVALVRVILVIEDSIPHYSVFLPVLYSQVFKQTQHILSEEITDINRQLRMRMRPKVVLVHDAASADKVYRAYKDNLLCIITDVQFERSGQLDDLAGVRFIEGVREDGCRVPVLLQSSEESNRRRAWALGAHFIDKGSPRLKSELRDFIVSRLGFGDFVFRTEDGHEIAHAGSMSEFMHRLRTIPDDSLVYHARNNHYSAWLIAHGEVAFAKKLQPLKVMDFQDNTALRGFLLEVFDEVERSKNRGRVVESRAWDHVSREQIVRLRSGSLGGKGRGLAFLNALVYALDFKTRFPGVDVTLPATFVIGTNEFDEFIERNGIGRAMVELPDAEIRERFVAGRLSDTLVERLWKLVDHVRAPLAVRSSGLLEDSQSCPFAGVYQTLMIPNNDSDPSVRVGELEAAIKLVFASVFEKHSREYIEGAKFNLDEEKMAVVVQEIAGEAHGDHWYPDFSGVAQSYNFYPTGPMKPSDGIASVALGLGKTVMEGGRILRFCPRYPKHDILELEELMRQSPREFWSIRLVGEEYAILKGEEGTLGKLTLRDAERHGTLAALGSVWDMENDRLVDGLSMPGPRVVTFANVLKYGQFPLAELLEYLLHLGEIAMGVPVELEFAVTLRAERKRGIKPAFFLLQIRPLNVNHEDVDVPELTRDAALDAVVYTNEGLGNGTTEGLEHVLYVESSRFAPTETLAIAGEINQLNRQMRDAGKGYMLVGPGRWGSRDRFLGVPVGWPDISEARAIVECDLKEFRVESSQGTHFFHNVVSMNVGYLKVRWGSESSWIDWDWLGGQQEVARTEHCRLVRTSTPIDVTMDGKSSRALVARRTSPEQSA